MSTEFTPPPISELLNHAWSELAAARDDHQHPWHLPVLCTADADGPDGRTVVLRHADRATHTIGCHTDHRAPKSAGLERPRPVAWLFYDPQAKVQLRVRGEAQLHHDDAIAETAWAASRPGSRSCYFERQGPGAALSGAPGERHLGDEGYVHFAVLRCRLHSIDWLHLRGAGHLRAQFRREGDHWTGDWVAP